MPQLPFSQALTANQLGFNPAIGWAFEFLPWPAAVEVLIRGTTTGVRLAVKSGSTELVPRTPVQGGGTAGVTPSVLNTSPVTFVASPGDRLQLVIDEVLGGTPTVDGLITVEPL